MASNNTTTAVVDKGLGETQAYGPFPYIINEPNKCTESRLAPFLVLLITTEAKQVEARNVIRQTWANESVVPNVGIIRLFLLGKKQEEQENQQQMLLEAESKKHHDLIQQDFLDTYNNLTLKTLMGMNWVARHCPQANYVMKTDSDMFINTNYLIHKILQPQLQSKTNYFTGRLMINASPIRDRRNKWYISEEEYRGGRYPIFCSGTGYLFSGDLAEKIYTASLCIPRIHLEDVYVGMCLAKLQIQPRPPPNGNLFNHWRLPYSSCKYSSLVTSHGFRPSEILKYWQDLQSKKQNPCAKRVQKKKLNRTEVKGKSPHH
ncbi:beta-1,3-galactosyltransferase 2 [Lampetra planeri]